MRGVELARVKHELEIVIAATTGSVDVGKFGLREAGGEVQREQLVSNPGKLHQQLSQYRRAAEFVGLKEALCALM